MSQHALKLAEALKKVCKLAAESAAYPSSAPRLQKTIMSMSSVAAISIQSYLASDEYREDLQRERAAAAGFQGLADEPKEIG